MLLRRCNVRERCYSVVQQFWSTYNSPLSQWLLWLWSVANVGPLADVMVEPERTSSSTWMNFLSTKYSPGIGKKSQQSNLASNLALSGCLNCADVSGQLLYYGRDLRIEVALDAFLISFATRSWLWSRGVLVEMIPETKRYCSNMSCLMGD
jgi:hypothetical protein